MLWFINIIRKEKPMGLPTATVPAKKKLGPSKLVLGFAALAATAILGTTGMAAAAHGQSGSGYGGGNVANIHLDLDVSGNNNVINIILNLF